MCCETHFGYLEKRMHVIVKKRDSTILIGNKAVYPNISGNIFIVLRLLIDILDTLTTYVPQYSFLL